jgi:hypothetical protein
MRVTVDTNFLIDLDTNGISRDIAKRILELHRTKVIEIQVVAIAASERQVDGNSLSDFGEFKDRLERLGLSRVCLLNPMAYLNVCYIGHCVIAGTEQIAFEKQIHDILFPNIDFVFDDFVSNNPGSDEALLNRRWRNARCDVQSMWAHIKANNEIFLTRDGNFVKESKKARLVALGANSILTPEEVLDYFTNEGST